MTNSQDETLARPWHTQYGSLKNGQLKSHEYTNLPEMISKNSAHWGKKPAYAMVLPNGMSASLTFEETNELSDYFAVYLREELKLLQGDRVLIQMPNCLAYPIVVFGVLKAGGIIVNTNPLYTTKEMEHQYNDAEAKILVIIDMFAHKLKEVIPNTSVQKVILVSIAELFPNLKKRVIQFSLKYIKKQIPKCEVFANQFESALQIGKRIKKEKNIPVQSYWENLTLIDLCALQYTGGTTGISKGAMLTHGNILANMFQIFEIGKSKLDFGKETILTALPLYHIFAFTVNLISFYCSGGLSVLIPNPRPLSNLKKSFDKYPITWIVGVNTLYNGLLNENWFKNHPPKFLKASIAGGTALHKSVAERWEKVTKTIIVEGFGLTETSPAVTFNPIGGTVKSETVGIPLPSTDVTLLDDNGSPVAIGQPGEIAVKGPQVMAGYWNRPDETSKVFNKDGWLLTGDIGVMDFEGYIKIVDRKKDMILVSGFNVYPNEVEDCISKLAGVQEVGVVGIADNKTGEMVKAFVVKKDISLTDSQIFEHCKKYLTHYKIPKQIQFINEMPKTPVGKILRKNLRLPLQ